MNSDEAQAYSQARAAFTSSTKAAAVDTMATSTTAGGVTAGGDYEPGWDPAQAAVADEEGEGEARDRVERPQLPHLRIPQPPIEHKSSDNMIRSFADSAKQQTPPLHAFSPINPRNSFSAHNAPDTLLGGGGISEKDNANFNLPKLSNFHTLGDAEKEMRGLRLIGDFSAGDFFGYASLMKDAPHEFSLVATAPCTVFVLSKTTIYKLIHSEPVVGLRLQEALGSAISAQAASLGQSHRRRNRAEFLRDLKDKVCEQHHLGADDRKTRGWGSTGRVKRALDAIANERERSGKQTNTFFDVAGAGSSRELSPSKKSATGVQQPRRVVAEGMSSRVTLVKNARRFQSLRRRFSYKAGIAPIQEEREDLGAPPAEKKSKPTTATAAADATKRLKKLDHLLNDQTMLYDSDEEDPRRAAQEQAVAQMLELVKINRHNALTAETPRQKLQRLLRKAVRQYRRRKAREGFERRTTSYSDLTGIDKYKSFAVSMRLYSFHDDSMLGLSSSGAATTNPRRSFVSGAATQGRASAGLLQTAESHRKSARPGSISAPPKLLVTQKSTWRSSVQGVSLGLQSISAMRHHTSRRPHTYLTRYEMSQIKKGVDRNRRWSYGSMEGILLAAGLRASNEQSATEEEVAATLGQPLSQQPRFSAARARRQSFPSLDNAEWRDQLTYQAVL